jgi:hypothetical protein
MTNDAVFDIARELVRICADADTTAEEDSIGVNDEGDGWASLGASPRRADFYWYGRADALLDSLRAVPAGAGPDTIRARFTSDYHSKATRRAP